MLARGKFPQIAITAAVIVAALLLVNLATANPPARSLFHSNSLDLAMVLLATISSIYVARQTRGYVRQLWILLATALGLESTAQAISTYYQSFVAGATEIPWPSDVLFFVWVAPAVMMLLPYSEEETERIDWLRLLDFGQVAIVAATAYLYFFYVPSRWKFEGIGLVRQMLVLYVARDVALFLGFLLRTRTVGSRALRGFFTVMSVVFLAAGAADTDYLVTLKSLAGSASWADVLWALPYLFVVLYAVTWRYEAEELRPERASRFGDIVVTHVLPVGIPLLVIFMGGRIAQEQLMIAWAAVTASFVCSALRLILTNRKQRRIARELRATEEALRRSEHIFESAFRFSPDAISINVFGDGPFLDVNEGFTGLTGYERGEILGKKPSELNLWMDLSQRNEMAQRLVGAGVVHEEEIRLRRKTGQIRTAQMSAALIELDGQRCSLVVVRDITERKEAENILSTNEERFRSLVENLHVGIVTYGPEGAILYANQAALEMLDLKQDDLMGKTSKQLGLLAVKEDGTPLPDDMRPVLWVIASKKPLYNQMIGWQRPGMAEIMWTLLDAVPEFNREGELRRVVVSFSNLTEQRRTLEALRESEARFRTLVRDLHVAVVLHGPDTSIQFANPAALAMFGLTQEAVVGKQVQDLGFVPVDEEGHEIPLDELPVPQVLRTHSQARNVVIGFQRPGAAEILWIFGNAAPQFDEKGSVIRVIGSFSDISQMKNAQRAIQQLSAQLLKLQDEERRRIGRELHDGLAQTVLAINLSLAQVRQTLKPGEEQAGRALEKARGLLQQMSREIRTLSYLLHPPLLDDLGLVSALKEYARGFSERSGIETQLYVLTEFGRLSQTAETAMFRIVQESLANIQRHSGSKTAKIRLWQEAANVILEVTDFGRGMRLPTNGNAKPDEARLGVGIPGMQERVAQLGGVFDIESGPTGTTVRATIPLADAVSEGQDDGSAAYPHRG